MKERLAIRFANWILRTFAPKHAVFVAGAIEYGMRAAAEDTRSGKPAPADWRPVTDACVDHHTPTRDLDA